MNADFKIRPYSKAELARLYFPSSPSERTAVANLRIAMLRCRPMMRELFEANYVPHARMFTPRQVAIIVRYLGEPF